MTPKSHVRIFGVPVRFDPTFVILAAGFGYLLFLHGDDPQGAAMFMVWIPLVTIAILAHELGHALVGRLFGLDPFVILHGMGGLTSFPSEDHRALSHGRRILITLAGPFTGVLVGVAAFALERSGLFAVDSVPQRALTVLFWVTAGWGLLNLLPILPLDGGHVVATALDRLFGRKGVQAARLGSVGMALLAAGASALGEYWFGAALCGLLAFGNYRAFKLDGQRHAEAADVGPELDAGYAALAAGEVEAAGRIADQLAGRVEAEADRLRHAHLAAWAALLDGDPARARLALDALPAGHAADAFLEGRLRLAEGRAAAAIEPLLEALLDRRDEEVAEALGDAIEASGDADALLARLEDAEAARTLGARLARAVASRIATPPLAREVDDAIAARFGPPSMDGAGDALA